MSDVSPTPNLLWRLFVIGGVGTMVAVSVNDDAWESFDDLTGGAVDRDVVKGALGATVGLHTLESISACRSASKAGLRHPLRWGLATFVWGFPVLLRLHKAKKAKRAESA